MLCSKVVTGATPDVFLRVRSEIVEMNPAKQIQDAVTPVVRSPRSSGRHSLVQLTYDLKKSVPNLFVN